MIKRNNAPRSLRRILLGSAALGLALWMPQVPNGALGFVSSAYAQSQGGSSGSGSTHRPTTAGQGGQGGSTSGHRGQGGSTSGQGGSGGSSTTGASTSGESSGSGSGQGGSTSGQRGQGGATTGGGSGQGQGQGGQGGQGGGSGGGGSGGKPVWAQGGIPEVELGRLSVARAPDSVRAKALDEALSTWSTMSSTTMTLVINGVTRTITVAQLYSYSAAQFAAILANNYDAILRIDSPLQNLALMESYATTGKIPLSGVTTPSKADMLGIYLGSAADKETPITTDTVIALNTILGLNLTPTQIANTAVAAEEVRVAISTAHG